MTSNFPLLMKHLPGEQFATDTDVTQAVTYWLQTFYDDCFYSGKQSILSSWENAYEGVLISP